MDANPRKPKERPLRTKRGHRKPSAVGDAAGDAESSKAPAADSNQPGSPGSESQAPPAEGQAKDDAARDTENGANSPAKAPASAFELYCVEARLKAKEKDEEPPTEDDLAQSWKELGDAEQAEVKTRYEREFAEAPEDEDHPQRKKKEKPTVEKSETQDEDVEMGNYDTEDQEAQAEKEADE